MSLATTFGNSFFLAADGTIYELTPDGPVDYLKEQAIEGFIQREADKEFMQSLGVIWP